MNAIVKKLLKTFDNLTDSQQLELASEILKRVTSLDLLPLSDEDLVLNAEAIFLELDKQETYDEQS